MAKSGSGKTSAMIYHVSIFMASVVSIWSAAAFLSGLATVNWQLSELLRQYLMAVGLMQEHHTFVDFYTHIKGVEYIIALTFLCLFPVGFKMVNRMTPAAENA